MTAVCVRYETEKGEWRMPWLTEATKDVISCGEMQMILDPQISEWDNPTASGGHPHKCAEANRGN